MVENRILFGPPVETPNASLDPMDYWVDENSLGLILWEEIYSHNGYSNASEIFIYKKERERFELVTLTL